MRTYYLFSFAFLNLALSCNTNNTKTEIEQSSITTQISYAKGFSVRQIGQIKEVVVSKPYQGATKGYTYWLVPKNVTIPEHSPDVKIIFTPIRSIACTSTTHIPLLDYLNESHRLVAFPTTDYISSDKMRLRIDSGKVTDIGIDKGLNIELLATLKPDMVMAYTMTGDYGQFKKIEELNMNVVLNAEYLEEHPLGRAEWIKYMALFLNKEKQADSVFRIIEKNYLDLQEKIKHSTATNPTVFSGIVYGDAWFMPAGQNYAAKLLRDAGYNYLWSTDATSGFLQLSFEAVYEKAHQANYWIGVGSYKTLAEIETADSRFSKFNAFKNKNVYTYNARIGTTGGSEFLELGYLRPDLILYDLVKISHPAMLPQHQLFFHKRLD
jgi:iron complex transport system substrate-binding protein